jgi:hypothetical protein
MSRSYEARRRSAAARLALLREMECEVRHIPDAPEAPESAEDLPFGDPRTLTPEAQGGGQ